MAERALQSGQFEILSDYGNGMQSSSNVRFDFGGAQGVPRFHIVTTYQSPESNRVVEQIMIGDQTWQREADGTWTAIAAQEGVWGQVQPFLPQAASASSPEATTEGERTVLQWYDAGRDTDVRLELDPASGTPTTLRRATRATGVVLTATYAGWNTPVEITPPDGT
jgi:hypothetical protein